MRRNMKTDPKKPTNKATADAPAEEFIAPDSSHASTENDRDHGAEVPSSELPVAASDQRISGGASEIARTR